MFTSIVKDSRSYIHIRSVGNKIKPRARIQQQIKKLFLNIQWLMDRKDNKLWGFTFYPLDMFHQNVLNLFIVFCYMACQLSDIKMQKFKRVSSRDCVLMGNGNPKVVFKLYVNVYSAFRFLCTSISIVSVYFSLILLSEEFHCHLLPQHISASNQRDEKYNANLQRGASRK